MNKDALRDRLLRVQGALDGPLWQACWSLWATVGIVSLRVASIVFMIASWWCSFVWLFFSSRYGHLESPDTLVGALVFFIVTTALTFVPGAGILCGLYVAVEIWDWSWFQAGMAFVGPVLLFILCIPLSALVSRDGTNSEP
ncbi:MAG TPA: hypothetical protein VE028_00135 [Nitratidesulfovibrio sp.]|nr:hypothetical protein [Nitratidesulfovibrio sp.]